MFWATSQTALPIHPIWPIFLVDRLKWQCCLAGSFKTAPKILIFSMAMGADYSFELIFKFDGRNNSFLASAVWGVILISMEPNFIRMLFSIKNQKFMML